MNVTERLASFVFDLGFDDLPKKVIKKAKLHLLDFIGVSLDGFRKGIYKQAQTLFGQTRQESTVLGEGYKTTCTHASFLNCIMASSSNFEDGHRFAAGHPSAIVIPAALAIAERQNSTGKDFLLSVVLGYEVFSRIGRAINPSHLSRGFHSTASIGPFGSAIAASKLLNLDAERICKSIDIAAVFAGSGLLEALTTELRYFQVANGCLSGLIAALLAQQEISTPKTILDGRKGFCTAMSDRFDLGIITRGLGEDFEIMNAYLKIHGGCRHIHAPMDAVQKIILQNHVSIDDIKKIKISTYPVAVEYEIDDPQKGTEAEFSIPFGVSVAILEKFTGPEVFSDGKTRDPNVRNLMKKVVVEVDEGLASEYPQKRGVIAEVVTQGNSFQCKLDVAKGDPEFPLTEEDLTNKFKYLTSYCFDSRKAERVMDDILSVEKFNSLHPIIQSIGVIKEI